MKANLKARFAALILFGFCSLIFIPQVNAQNEKAKPRLSVEYHKTTGEPASIFVKGKFKGEDGYEPTVNLDVNIYKVITEDSLAFLGTVTTNAKGEANYTLPEEQNDTALEHYYVVKVEDNDKFKDADSDLMFMDASLTAEIIEEDSIKYVVAQLLDADGNPIEGQSLKVKVRRLFAPLTIGESSYDTDEDGSIMVEIEDPIPSKSGVLTFEVVLESDDYGIVKAVFDAPIGVVIADLDTFDKRTMWSPPGKTPLFIFVFANIIILGIWIVIVLLIRNIIKIKKS